MTVAVAGLHTYTDSVLSSGSVLKSASSDRSGSVVMMGLSSDSAVGSGIPAVGKADSGVGLARSSSMGQTVNGEYQHPGVPLTPLIPVW